MISRKVISSLLATLAVLTVACVVLLGFHLLLSALQDGPAAATLRGLGLGCLVLLIIDFILLVGALAVRVLEHDANPDDRS